MKIINIILLLSLCLNLTACKDEGGGVIVVEDPKAETPTPPYQGPFGGPISGDEEVPDPSPYLPAYDAFALQELINNAQPGDTLELDRNVDLRNIGLIIDKPLTITGAASLNRPVLFKATNVSSLFYLMSNNLTLNNIKFDLFNTPEFAATSYIGSTPEFGNLTLSRSQVLLRGNSSLVIKLSGVLINQSTIIGLSTVKKDTIGVARIQGTNITLTGNNFIDATNSYISALGLVDVVGAVVRENVFRSFAPIYYGAITLSDVKDMVLESNVLYDANVGKENSQFGTDPEFTGSVAISFQFIDNLSDNGLTNSFNAELFRLDDFDEGFSTNINLVPGALVNIFDKDNLFNFFPSEDFSPFCAIGTNPTISATPKSTWSSYVRQNGSTLYYSGAIKPACL